MFLSLKPHLPQASKPGPGREVAPPSDGCVFPESLAWYRSGTEAHCCCLQDKDNVPGLTPGSRSEQAWWGGTRQRNPLRRWRPAPLMLQTQGPVNLHLCTCGHGARGHSYGGLPYETRGLPEAGGRGRTATLQPVLVLGNRTTSHALPGPQNSIANGIPNLGSKLSPETVTQRTAGLGQTHKAADPLVGGFHCQSEVLAFTLLYMAEVSDLLPYSLDGNQPQSKGPQVLRLPPSPLPTAPAARPTHPP